MPHERTKRASKSLTDYGYRVVEKWECDYLSETKLNRKQLQENRNEFFKILPLDPRDSLFGERTSPACLYYEIKENKKINYNDFTSLSVSKRPEET